MACARCDSSRILEVTSKCSDRCHARYNGHEKEGYAPEIPAFGGDDYIQFKLCLDCGHMFGNWPLDDAAVAKAFGNPVFCDECCEEFVWADDLHRCSRCGRSLCEKCGGGSRYCEECAGKVGAEKEFGVW